MGKQSGQAAAEPPYDSPEEPLVLAGHYNYGDRPRNDAVWSVVYVVFLALSVFGGLYGSAHRCVARLDALARL